MLHEEKHKSSGDFLKSVIFGGMDGILTTFAVVSAVSVGSLDVKTVLILGFSNVFADALSMGLGDALSGKAEMDYIKKEKQREEWYVMASLSSNTFFFDFYFFVP